MTLEMEPADPLPPNDPRRLSIEIVEEHGVSILITRFRDGTPPSVRFRDVTVVMAAMAERLTGR